MKIYDIRVNLVLELLLEGHIHPCTFEKTNLFLELCFRDQFHPPSELDIYVDVQLIQTHLKLAFSKVHG